MLLTLSKRERSKSNGKASSKGARPASSCAVASWSGSAMAGSCVPKMAAGLTDSNCGSISIDWSTCPCSNEPGGQNTPAQSIVESLPNDPSAEWPKRVGEPGSVMYMFSGDCSSLAADDELGGEGRSMVNEMQEEEPTSCHFQAPVVRDARAGHSRHSRVYLPSSRHFVSDHSGGL